MKQRGKRLLSVLLTLVMLLGMIPGGVTIEARAEGGSGTQDDPAIIKTAAELSALATVETNDTYYAELGGNISDALWTTIPAGKKVVLDLAGHTITIRNRNDKNSPEKNLFAVSGELTIEDSTDTAKNGTGNGNITGMNYEERYLEYNNLTYRRQYYNCEYEAGVINVKSGGLFTLNSGKISGNINGTHDIAKGTTLNSYSGSVSFSGVRNYAGGVGIQGGGTFVMNGGRISDNTAYFGAGVGMESGATFKMYGGVITGNNAVGGLDWAAQAGSGYMAAPNVQGGGVGMSHGGTLILGGTAQITGNYAGINGTTESNIYSNLTYCDTEVTNYNISRVIRLSSDHPLEDSARIGVSLYTLESYNTPKPINFYNEAYVLITGEDATTSAPSSMNVAKYLATGVFSLDRLNSSDKDLYDGLTPNGTSIYQLYVKKDRKDCIYFGRTNLENPDYSGTYTPTALSDQTPVSVVNKTSGNPANTTIGDVLGVNCEADDITTYNWYHREDLADGNDSATTIGTGSTYTTVAADFGKNIVVTVSNGTTTKSGDNAAGPVKKKTPAALSDEEAAAAVSVDYPAETASPTDNTYELSTDNENSATAPVSLTSVLDAEGTPTIYVRRKATADTDAGAWVAVTLESRPAAPESLTTENATNGAAADGKIQGTKTTMEYKGTTGSWADATDQTTLTLPGTYSVRFKATQSAPASKSAVVQVGSNYTALNAESTPVTILRGGERLETAPQIGDELTADTVASPISGYQWFVSEDGGTDASIEGATAATFTVTKDQLGKHLKVELTQSANAGGEGNPAADVTVASDRTEPVEKKSGPEAPESVEAAATDTTITVTSPVVEQNSPYEYSIDNGTKWQPSPEFGKLNPGTEYQVKVRFKATDDTKPSAASAATTVVTGLTVTITPTSNGTTLTANVTGKDSATFTYQWLRSTNGTEWTNADGTGATSATYMPNAADVGKYLKVVATQSAPSATGEAKLASKVTGAKRTVETGTAAGGAIAENGIDPDDENARITGAKITVTVTPAAGYQASGLSVAPKTGSAEAFLASADEDDHNKFTYTQPDYDVVLTPVFAKIAYTLPTPTGNTYGTVSISSVVKSDGSTSTGNTNASVGDTVKLSVTPNDNCSLVSLTVSYNDGTDTITPEKKGDFYEFVMPAANITSIVGVFTNYTALTDDNKPAVTNTTNEARTVPYVGDVLTAFTAATPVTYEWYYADGSGAATGDKLGDGATYTVKPEDVGKQIVAVAKQAKDAGGAGKPAADVTETSVPTDAAVQPAVVLTGAARYGETLTAMLNPTAVAGDEVVYAWYRLNAADGETADKNKISDATASTYKIQAADIGKYLRVVVTLNESPISFTTVKVEPGVYATPVLSANKTVAATEGSGDSLKGKITVNGFENYRSDGVYAFSPDDGKTWFTESGTKYDITATITRNADGAQPPTVVFYGLKTNATYRLRVRGEAVVETINGSEVTIIRQGSPSLALLVKTPSTTVPLTGVTINGTAKVGETLTAAIYPENATGVTYQWYRDEINDSNKISGETGVAYTLTSADCGKTIKVVATGVNSSGSSTSVNASITGTVAPAPAAKINANNIRPVATTDTITVNGFANTSTRHYQYRLNGTDWQDSNVFSSLDHGTEYTVYVRTGGPNPPSENANWQASSVEDGYIGSQKVTTLANPNPFAGDSLSVVMKSFSYGGTVNPELSTDLLGGTAAYQYRKAGTGTWADWPGSAALDVGTYEIRATIAATDDYSAYTTAITLFKVSPAALDKPTIAASGATVTVSGNVPASKKVQYVVVNQSSSVNTGAITEWKTATLDSEGKFTLTGLKENYDYGVYVRAVPAANDTRHTFSDWSEKATGTTPTPTTKTVVYDLAGGSFVPGKTFANTFTGSYTLPTAADVKRTGYTFSGWELNGDNAGASVSNGGTLTAQWTPIQYSIAYLVNGGTGATMVTTQHVPYGTAVRLPENTYTKAGSIFAGWATTPNGPVSYLDGQSVMDLTSTAGTVSLYAVWETANTVGGKVYSGETGKVELTLKRGDVQVGSTLILPLTPNTGSVAGDGSDAYAAGYAFSNVPDGVYNLVAEQHVERTDADGNPITETLTITKLIEVSGNKTENVTMPNNDYSAIVSVTGDGTPPIVVNGLDTEAEESAIDDRSVKIEMSVQKQEAATADQETKDAMDAIAEEAVSQGASADEQRDYLNIDIEKEVKKNGQVESSESIRETANLLEIYIPYDLTGKADYQIALYRSHNGKPAKLGTSATTSGSYYTLDRANNRIVLHTQWFSTYAIGFDPSATEPVVHTTSGGSAGTYPVNITDPANGTVKADKTSASANAKVTITVTPNDGYRIGGVTVTDKDGKAIAAALNADGSYTFKMPASAVAVHVTFLKATVSPADTGVADWLITDEHIRYLNGYDDGTISPNSNITRAEAAMIFYRLLRNKEVEITKTFADVKDSDWYVTAVNTLASLNIINGYDDGLFHAGEQISRAEFAAIATRFAKATDGSVSFTDVTTEHWAYGNIATAAGYGWVSGYDGMFRPADKITRAEAATIVNHMLGRAADQEYVLSNSGKIKYFSDLQDATKWYYFDMVEASNEHDFTRENDVEKWTTK